MSDEGSPSLLNLRGFRFQKKPSFTHSPTLNSSLETSSDCSPIAIQRSTVRRRIISTSDSECDMNGISSTSNSPRTILDHKSSKMEVCNNGAVKNNQESKVIVQSVYTPNYAAGNVQGPKVIVQSVNASSTFTSLQYAKVHSSDLKTTKVDSSSPQLSYQYKQESILEKEKQMRFLRQTFPDVNAMSIHTILSKCDFNTEQAVKELNKNREQKLHNIDFEKWKAAQNKEEILRLPQHAPKESGVVTQYQVIVNKRPNTDDLYNKKKKVRRKREDMDSDDSELDNNDYEDMRVYNSDEESDVELSDDLTADKRRVLDFFQNATPNELQLMSSCSKKKIDSIIDNRPFTGWINLVEKLQENKNLNTDLLNAAQQVLATRNNVQQLMRKCGNLALQMERAVAAGAGMKTQPIILSSSLNLTSYQMVGLNWLAVMHAQGVNGILADEMGLGKTVQVIAFLAHLKETDQSKGTHLVIVPSSTLDNWKLEFGRWCPELRVFMYYGSTEERRMYRINWAKGGLADFDVILTTYTMVGNTPEERKMFRITQMHYVVFDEAHMLKNMNTQRYENLIRIKAMNRILLTGTPLQNNLLELMSLLIFVMPTMFAGKTEDLKSLFQKNSKSKQDSTDDLPPFEKEQIAQAKRIMRPFVLRRLKVDVLQDLPKKFDSLIEVPMYPSQKEQYDNLVRSFQSVGREVNGSTSYNGMTMMSDLRKLSNHPLLLRYYYQNSNLQPIAKRLAKDPNYKETKVQYIVDDLACMSDFEIHTLTREYKSISKYSLPDSLILTSGKFRFLDKKLSELKNSGHRVLIFSQYVIMLNVMEAYMELREYSYLRLDGSTPVHTRQELIDQYTEDSNIFIFLLSTKAGGLGINLTAADTVIIHDIDFNPYNDKQAEDRCHRMGQSRPVHVYRLISKGTIEEAMWQMNQEKLKLEKELTTDENESTDVRSVVRLLSTALGIDSSKATNLVSPKKKS